MQVGLQSFGRVAGFHPPALGHLLAVDPDFEGHGSLLGNFVIYADHRDEPLGRTVQVDVHFAQRVRADTVPELLPVDLQRIIIDRSARVRLAPSLLDLGKVKAFEPNRSLRGFVAGEHGLIEFGRSRGGRRQADTKAMTTREQVRRVNMAGS